MRRESSLVHCLDTVLGVWTVWVYWEKAGCRDVCPFDTNLLKFAPLYVYLDTVHCTIHLFHHHEYIVPILYL